jgi:coenzyme F420-reducing hydrogenase beta subunit
MIKIDDKTNCSGCTACASICPNGAIIMIPDVLGFLYPEVDTEQCINCHLCERVCIFNDNYYKNNNYSLPLVFAVRHKSLKEIETSQSGAMFSALVDWILENNGVVYGAGYTKFFRVIHKRATTKEECNEFKGSKYVQSDMNTVFKQVKDDLQKSKEVLFSGTPCQTAGLYSYLRFLNMDTENLYLCDIVCHGVPSPYFWQDYLEYIKKRKKDTLIKVNFRDKKFGWSSHKETFTFCQGHSHAYMYTYIFYKHIMLRHSCEKCYFTNLHRPSDITIADFWGYERLDKNFGIDNKGVSLVLINNDKGRGLFDNVKDRIYYIRGNTSDCLQHNLQYPTKIHEKRDEFERDYQIHDFKYMLRKYGNIGFLHKFKGSFARILQNGKNLAKGYKK